MYKIKPGIQQRRLRTSGTQKGITRTYLKKKLGSDAPEMSELPDQLAAPVVTAIKKCVIFSVPCTSSTSFSSSSTRVPYKTLAILVNYFINCIK